MLLLYDERRKDEICISNKHFYPNCYFSKGTVFLLQRNVDKIIAQFQFRHLPLEHEQLFGQAREQNAILLFTILKTRRKWRISRILVAQREPRMNQSCTKYALAQKVAHCNNLHVAKKMGRKAQTVYSAVLFMSLKINRYFGHLSRLCGEKFGFEFEKCSTTKSRLVHNNFIDLIKYKYR